MRTTIELPDPLFRNARVAAAQKGITLKELFTEALRRALEEPKGTQNRMTKPPILGTKIPARSNAELAVLLEEEEIPKSR